jgi:hypothetical protein
MLDSVTPVADIAETYDVTTQRVEYRVKTTGAQTCTEIVLDFRVDKSEQRTSVEPKALSLVQRGNG